MTKTGDSSDIRALFREKGIVYTTQREIIARELFRRQEHVAAEELYAIVSRDHPKIGLATVYRSLNRFKDSGIIEERNFGDGWRRFENRHPDHHDHLICLGCGAVVEFERPEIEDLQETVALEHGFLPVSHRMVLHGYCPDCREDKLSEHEEP
jgi:Fur family ferric uptake transcriptional regulator